MLYKHNTRTRVFRVEFLADILFLYKGTYNSLKNGWFDVISDSKAVLTVPLARITAYRTEIGSD